MQVSFGCASGVDAIKLSPDAADGYSTGRYAASLDLAGLGLTVGADGLLRIEFSETYKDLALGTADGRWLSGQLILDVSAATVPEPGTGALTLLALALPPALRQRRR